MTVRHALVIAPHGGVGAAVARELRRRGFRVSGAGRTAPETGLVEAFFTIDLATTDWPSLYDHVAETRPLGAVVYAAGAGAFGRTPEIPDGDFGVVGHASEHDRLSPLKSSHPGLLAIVPLAGAEGHVAVLLQQLRQELDAFEGRRVHVEPYLATH